jgi:hypothetical protein
VSVNELLKAFATDEHAFNAAVDLLWGSCNGSGNGSDNGNPCNDGTAREEGLVSAAAPAVSGKAGCALQACLVWRQQHLIDTSAATGACEDACARWCAERGDFTAAVRHTRRAVAGLEARFKAAAAAAGARGGRRPASRVARAEVVHGAAEESEEAGIETAGQVEAAAPVGVSSELGHEYFKLAELCYLAGDARGCAAAATTARQMLSVCLGPMAAEPLLADLEGMERALRMQISGLSSSRRKKSP